MLIYLELTVLGGSEGMVAAACCRRRRLAWHGRGYPEKQMDVETDKPRSSGKRVAADLRELIQLEIALAKSELASKGRNVALGVGLLIAAALGGLMLMATLLTAAILAVALAVPGWAAALVVAGLLALLVGACVLIGIKFLHSAAKPLPTQAIETSKENLEWLKARLKSARK
jgi:predicted phage tail protein